MTEPASTASASFGLGALAVTLAGPICGPYALIVVCSLCGAFWAVGDADTKTMLAGVWLLLRCVLTAVLLSVFLATAIERTYGVPVLDSLPPVAFIIGALGNGWRPVFAAVGAMLSGFAARIGGPR